jgi:hypothetical protein
MSLRKVTLQLAKRNKISPTEQINRKLSPTVIESFNYRFSVKAIVFVLMKRGKFAKICQAQHMTQLLKLKSNTKSSLWNFMAGCERIGASFARVLGVALNRKLALFDNISKEFVTKRVNARVHPIPFDPSFKAITSYGKSKSAVDKFLAELEYEQKKQKKKETEMTTDTERELTDG